MLSLLSFILLYPCFVQIYTEEKLKIAEFNEKIFFMGDDMKIERLEKLRDEKNLLKKRSG